MNKLSILAGSFLTVLLASAAFAQDPQTTPPNSIKQKQGPRNMTKMLRKQDANSDGKLAREEWKGKAQGFDRLDQDKDGFLTREELASPVKSALSKLDTDNDGKVARAEWKGKPRGFDRLDANGDGFLTPEEFAQRRAGKRGGTPPPPTGTPKPGISG